MTGKNRLEDKHFEKAGRERGRDMDTWFFRLMAVAVTCMTVALLAGMACHIALTLKLLA
ncbi:hypothetical protein [Slackia isoflavoniconvertens]|uniref:hypothetical protein n=1 Tax=Slackia isoflavoniconvertens TaxID=572010 RepID=UPI003F9A5B01